MEKTPFGKNHLLTLTWIHRATLTWSRADLAALCWSGRPLVQLHTLHYHWLPSEPSLRQFWAINWQRIRERTVQVPQAAPSLPVCLLKGAAGWCLNSSSSVYLGYSLTPSHHHFSAALCLLTLTEIVSLLNSFYWGSFLLLQQAWGSQRSLFLDDLPHQLTI